MVNRTACLCGCGNYPQMYSARYIRGHRPPKPLAERLFSRAELQPSGCIEWQGYKDSKGYGQILGEEPKSKRTIGTHRAAWILANGPIPDGLFVCHKCDNPPCLNIDHLFLGTCSDNAQDMVRKGRGYAARGIDNWNTRLTDEQVREIRRRYVRHAPVGSGSASAELAAEFGVTQIYISQLARGVWRKSA